MQRSGFVGEIKKRVSRTFIHEFVGRIEADRLHGMIHWHDGDHTVLDIATTGRGRWGGTKQANAGAETAALITALVRMMPASSIAAVLNRVGKRTKNRSGWTAGRIQLLRNDHQVLAYREGQRVGR